MRKLMHSKKGFTLVELMIVVVIMAILVAVAVPIYGAVTKNAEKRSCQSNMKTIVSNMGQFQMSGGDNGEQLSNASLSSIFNNIDLASAPANFTKLFNDGIPTCPTTPDAQYKVKVDAEGKTSVTCPSPADLGHKLAASTN